MHEKKKICRFDCFGRGAGSFLSQALTLSAVLMVTRTTSQVNSSASSWSTLRTAQKLEAALLTTSDHSRAVVAAAEQMAEGVVLEVDDVSKLQGVSKSKQGDATLHTIKAWEQRFALRREVIVREALHRWWSTLVATIRPSFAEGDAIVLDEPTYVRLYKMMSHALATQEDEPYSEVRRALPSLRPA